MNLAESYLLLIVMLAAVAVVTILFRGKNGLIVPTIFAAGLITTLIAGLGFRIREVTEGPFVYVDTAMWVLCGAAFAYLLYTNGTYEYLFSKIIAKKRGAAVQMFLLILFIGLPGMITGSFMASVATTGLLAGRYLLSKGMEKSKVVEVVAVGSLMGMLLPPLCLPAMALTVGRQGIYPGSFEGYFLPILILTLPALLTYCILSGRRILGEFQADTEVSTAGSVACLIPMVVVALMVLGYNFLYNVIPYYGGYPVIYVVGFVLALVFKCKGANPLLSAADGIRTVAIELAMIMSYACAIEVFNTVGVTGTLSAQLLLMGVSDTMIVVIGGILVLIAGLLLGAPFAYTLCALVMFLAVNANYGYYELIMMGLGVIMALNLFTSLRGGIVDSVCDQLEITGVPGIQIVKRNIIPVLLLAILAFVFMVGAAQLKFLMI
ncbi:MAG: hypothetical protein DBY24_05695 [Prevotellaceae bacterium]|nr:MAG: hypothetical protein DBY24_05695 [Prevotellaceae bacterium]